MKKNENESLSITNLEAYSQHKMNGKGKRFLNINNLKYMQTNNDIFPSQTKINVKRMKSNLTNIINKSNQLISEKSSERNIIEDYSEKSQNNLNLNNNDINKNNNLIDEKGATFINGEEEKNNNGFISIKNIKTKLKIQDIQRCETLNINDFIDIKLSKGRDNKLIIKNKRKNIIGINIDKNIANNIFSNKKIKINRIISSNLEFICLFCGITSLNEKYNSLFTCKHFFCSNCGKNFYEDIIIKILNNKDFETEIKCPIMKCQNIVSLDLLKRILPERLFLYIKEYIENKEKIRNKKGKININIMPTELMLDNKNNNNEKVKYLYDNVIDINTKGKFVYYIKKTFIRCFKCKEYSLYGNIKGNYDICLNCLNKYCKFCHKIFDERHMDKTYENHCRVIYRTFKDFTEYQNIKKFVIFLLYTIGGYLFLVTYFILKIQEEIKKKKKLWIKCVKIMIYLILFFIFLPIAIIIIPYFPIILLI